MRTSSAPCTLRNPGPVSPSEDRRPTPIRLQSVFGIRCRRRKVVRCKSTDSTTISHPRRMTRPISRVPKYLHRTAQEARMSLCTIHSTRLRLIRLPLLLLSQSCNRFVTLPAQLLIALNQTSAPSTRVYLPISHLEAPEDPRLEFPGSPCMSPNQHLL